MISVDRLKGIKAVAFDIDDTITVEGRVTDDAYHALWRLHDAGLILLAVTGRPAGWCDLIARAWPVNGVVGENGAFAYLRKGRHIERFDVAPAPTQQELKEMEKQLLDRFPTWRSPLISSVADSMSQSILLKRSDLFRSLKQKVAQAFRDAGWTAKVSSIHVNGWRGTWDKASTLQRCLVEHYQLDAEKLAYVGDSPNDAPMFSLASLSIGVANIHRLSRYRNPTRIYHK